MHPDMTRLLQPTSELPPRLPTGRSPGCSPDRALLCSLIPHPVPLHSHCPFLHSLSFPFHFIHVPSSFRSDPMFPLFPTCVPDLSHMSRTLSSVLCTSPRFPLHFPVPTDRSHIATRFRSLGFASGLCIPLGTFLYSFACFYVLVTHSVSLIYPCTSFEGSLVCGSTRLPVPEVILSFPKSFRRRLVPDRVDPTPNQDRSVLRTDRSLSISLRTLRTGTGSDILSNRGCWWRVPYLVSQSSLWTVLPDYEAPLDRSPHVGQPFGCLLYMSC